MATGQAIRPEGFEALYRRDPDPWRTRCSHFEAHKRAALLAACGPPIRARGLELACGAGAITIALARRCLRLVATDASPTAVAATAAFLGEAPRVEILQATLPKGMPRGPFDLIVASEIAYYLSERELAAVCLSIQTALAPGGRLVLLHHRIDFGRRRAAARDNS